jgi:hypothetical protein
LIQGVHKRLIEETFSGDRSKLNQRTSIGIGGNPIEEGCEAISRVFRANERRAQGEILVIPQPVMSDWKPFVTPPHFQWKEPA